MYHSAIGMGIYIYIYIADQATKVETSVSRV